MSDTGDNLSANSLVLWLLTVSLPSLLVFPEPYALEFCGRLSVGIRLSNLAFVVFCSGLSAAKRSFLYEDLELGVFVVVVNELLKILCQ